MFKIVDVRCLDCDHVHEALVNAKDEASPSCPECSSTNTVRLIGAPNLSYTRMAASGKSSSDGMTTAIERWHKGRAQKMKIEKRNLERHGTYD